LKKGDLGGFENLQKEGIYGKRYKSLLTENRKPKRDFAVAVAEAGLI
jgi:hypothetical protein